MTHEWSWRAVGGVIINLEELQQNLHGLNQQQPQNSSVFSEQALNQCCGSRQLPVSSSSNQNIQFKNPILLTVSCDQWQYHMTDSSTSLIPFCMFQLTGWLNLITDTLLCPITCELGAPVQLSMSGNLHTWASYLVQSHKSSSCCYNGMPNPSNQIFS
jgi:hypothetical protein